MEGDSEDGRRGGAEAVADIVAALKRAVAGGPAVLEALLRQPEAARTLGTVMGLLGRGGGEQADQGPGAADAAAEAAGFLGQAYLIAATSGFRFWRRVAETAGEHQLELLRTVGEGGRGGQGALIDGLRAYARELGDVSLQEARLFQAELDRLSASLSSAEESEPRRRWKAKP